MNTPSLTLRSASHFCGMTVYANFTSNLLWYIILHIFKDFIMQSNFLDLSINSDIANRRIMSWEFYGLAEFKETVPGLFDDPTDLGMASAIIDNLKPESDEKPLRFFIPRVQASNNSKVYTVISSESKMFLNRELPKKKNAIILQYLLIKFELLKHFLREDKINFKNKLLMVANKLGITDLKIDKTYGTVIISTLEEFINAFDGDWGNVYKTLEIVDCDQNEPNVKLGLLLAQRFAYNAANSIE